jgi:hypothetical protein
LATNISWRNASVNPRTANFVGILVGHCDQPEQAGYVDDVAVPGRDHVGQKGFGAVDDAPEVDIHDPLDVLELRLLEVAVVGNAGIVVDLVDFAEVGHNRVGVGTHACLAKYRWPPLGICPKAALSTGASSLSGSLNAFFGSIATVHVNNVSAPSGSTT